jgi:isopentenyl phosphate kinase
MNIIKLGGSVVTYKVSDTKPPYKWDESSSTYRIRFDKLRDISKALRDHLDEGMILVHGGGTHGHRTVLRWRTGAAKGSEQIRTWDVKWRMLQLTEGITRILGKEKIPVIPVSPSDVMNLRNGFIRTFESAPINRILDRGGVPILRGDLVPVEKDGWSVVSGDEIMVRLVKEGISGTLPKANKAVMCMDVEGFLDSFGSPGSSILDRIDDRLFHSRISEWIGDDQARTNIGDVSGGILGKVISCHRISSMGTEAFMIGGDLSSTLSSVLSGKGGGTVFPAFEGGPDCPEGRCW